MSDVEDLDAERTMEPDVGAGAGLRDGPFVPAQELAEEPLLVDCGWTQADGEQRPAMGKYALLGVLGRGGMGTVFYGIDARLDVDVAIKVMARELQTQQPGMVRRFVQEAQLSARMRSPHIVRVLDVDRDGATGAYFLVMEYVRGASAGDWLETVLKGGRRGATEAEALDVCIGGTKGLAAAHHEGIVHRDVKPDNILIPRDDEGTLLFRDAKLADLGLARADDVVQRLTGTIMMLGTPGYAAPEQSKDGRLAKKPADVFTVGTTLYALLTGMAPFARSNPVQAIFATLHGRCKPVEQLRPDVSAPTLALLRKCMEPNPDKRFADATALLRALEICRESLAHAHRDTDETATSVIQLADLPESGKPAVTPVPGVISTQAPLDDDELRTARIDLGTLDVESLRRKARKSAAARAATPDTPLGDVPTTGRVEVAGGPTGTQISLQHAEQTDLSYRGRTDPQGRFVRDGLEPGRYALTASRPGYRVFTSELAIDPGGTCAVALAMRKSDGILAVRSRPGGARAFLDGKSIGMTPIAAARAAEGPHELRLSLDGHQDTVLTVELRAEERTDLGEIALAPPPKLDLSELAAGVSLRIEGRVLEHGDVLEAGAHQAMAFRPGFEPQEVRIEVGVEESVRPPVGEWTPSLWPIAADAGLWRAAQSADRERLARRVDRESPTLTFLRLETFECGGAAFEIAVFAHAATGLEFALVPGGAFEMGSPAGEDGRGADERAHAVSIDPFLIARTPVTQEAWTAVEEGNPSHFPGDRLPVERVSWEEARAFCAGAGLELPTEPQWEYACRAGTPTAYSFGPHADELGAYGWDAEHSRGRTRRVGTREPNAFGLYDVHGNVWEWCRDAYAEYPFEPSAETPRPTNGAYRVFRGGSWSDLPRELRSARRAAFAPGYRAWNLGFRPVTSLGIAQDTAPEEQE